MPPGALPKRLVLVPPTLRVASRRLKVSGTTLRICRSYSLKPNRSHESLNARSEVLTLLHKVGNTVPELLHRVASPGLEQPDKAAKFWDVKLSEAYDDLSNQTERPVKVVVYGLGEFSGSEELITALLADPLASNDQFEALRNRHESSTTSTTLDIGYGPTVEKSTSSLTHPSAFLNQFTLPLRISELKRLETKDVSSTPILDSSAEATLFSADIPIIVYNPLTTPLSTILNTRLPDHAILVISSSISQPDLDLLLKRHESRYHHTPRHSHHIPKLRHIVVDPYRALEAVKILQSDPTSVSAIQRYQDEFVGSKVSTITKLIHDRLQPITPASSALTSLKIKAALSWMQNALIASFDSVQASKTELDAAFVDVSRLKEQVEELQIRLPNEILQLPPEVGQQQPADGNIVKHAFAQADKELQQGMQAFTWWTMIWRVDSITSCVSNRLSKVWCPNLEKKLILETGKISVVQDKTAKDAFEILAKHPVLSSAVLQNQLLQITTNPSYTLTPETLIKPLETRRKQLIRHPVVRLHLAGQKSVWVALGGWFVGGSFVWAAWWKNLLGIAVADLFGGLESETLLGAGILTALASIRWSMAKWEKGKRRWSQDWHRVGEGLERDLEATIETTVKEKVVAVAETACEEASKVIQARDDMLGQTTKDLLVLQSSLDEITSKSDTQS